MPDQKTEKNTSLRVRNKEQSIAQGQSATKLHAKPQRRLQKRKLLEHTNYRVDVRQHTHPQRARLFRV